jgi:hypothetical protein
LVICLFLDHPTEATIASVPSVIRRMHDLRTHRCSRGNKPDTYPLEAPQGARPPALSTLRKKRDEVSWSRKEAVK